MKITQAQLETRVRRWQQKLATLGISHWEIDDIVISEKHPQAPEDGWYASCWRSTPYDKCEIWINASFLADCTAAQLDHLIVHEWIHAAMRDFDRALDSAEDWMPPATYTEFNRRLDHEREGFVDRLARTIVATHSDT